MNQDFLIAPFRRWIKLMSQLLVLALITSGCATIRDQPVVITPEQFDAVEAAGEEEEPPVRGEAERGAPVIVVEIPDRDSDVETPFSVRVRFEPQEGSTIDLSSLKIKYRWFDLTKQVLRRMTVTRSGIEGFIDAVKPGSYKLRVSIRDDQQRTGRATLRFRIVG